MISNERTVSDASTLTGWYKSSFSGGGQGECLEVARGYGDVPVRDSKAPQGPALRFARDGWASFVRALNEGQIAS
ncbi:DUF397 domain-containing protein [Streptomyces candidus]|uniref:DUF397 domain-containing protein n=1 Tax=Streptomyces candidus TaxID=67283 RepID=A0A7X0HG88_9ACTN|nr:DUF397 domain-containing protein [Streptomyces candidus]MBB6437060.1 hypothetical protein [Streptomyces candidus]GHH32820.1 hypothetical protein GCM10018773_02450 [Streptomyces candidus]